MTQTIESLNCHNCGAINLPYKTAISAPAMTVPFCNGDINMMAVCQYVRCPVCGLVTQSPRMSDERIDHYYASGLYRQTLGMTQADMDADELKRAMDITKYVIGKRIIVKSHVDIGSSRGYLLKALAADVQQGYDKNPKYGKMETDKSRLGKYELLTSIHVLEHVTEPLKDLDWYRSLCNEMILEVPGENCKGGPLRFAHLYYFPPDTLVKMIERAGFTVVDMTTNPNTRIYAR